MLHESVIAPTRNETIIFHSSRELRNDLEALWLSQVCITDEFQKYCEAKDRELAEKEIEDRKKEAVQKILNIYNAAYREQCYRTVLIEPFFTSCCIAMPAHLSLDLTHIVGQAGYIYSAGELIYCRSFSKATPKEFLGELRGAHGAIIENYSAESKRAPFAPVKFCVYSHEAFSKARSNIHSDSIHDSLEKIRIFKHKNFMGSILLSDLVGAVSKSEKDGESLFYVIGEQIDVSTALSQYKKQYQTYFQPPCTIFLVKDASIAPNGDAGNEHYYICYVQLLTNDNPFYHFQEDKPGWLSMVTTPHSLAAAMINIARRSWHNDSRRDGRHRPITIWDPFCSTGTIPFEIAKLGNDVHVTASDLMRSTEFTIKDNLMIFSSRATVPPAAEPKTKDLDLLQRETDIFSFDELLKQLSVIEFDFNDLEHNDKCPSSTAPARIILFWALNRVKSIVSRYVNDSDYDTEERQSIKPALFTKLRALREIDLLAQENHQRLIDPGLYKKYWLHRILLYIVWRCALTNIHEFVNGGDVPALIRQQALIKQELDRKIRKFEKLARSHLAPKAKQGDDAGKRYTLDRVEGKFSDSLTFAPEKLNAWWNDRHITTFIGEQGEVIKLASKYENTFDAIITDPPYGFNTNVDSGEEQLNFYRELMCALLKSVKNRGQIIFCLPDETVNGQAVPAYLRKPWVLRELFMQVSTLFPKGGRIVEFSSTKPRHGSLLFTPPYYWRSKKSLTRNILHLIVEKGPDEAGKQEGAKNGTPKAKKSTAKARAGGPPQVAH